MAVNRKILDAADEEEKRLLVKRRDEIRKEIDAEREAYNIEYFNNLKPFDGDTDKIPALPVLNEDVYQNVIVPNLIRCGAIPKKDLVVGETYLGACRNAGEAVWNGQTFTYKRTKFAWTYDEDINHFEDDNGYDLFVPLKIKPKDD